MPKIITLNIESNKHYRTVLPFLDKESPDIICLQEAPEQFAAELVRRGYKTAYAPMFFKKIENVEMSIGVMIASKYPFGFTKNYYYQNEADVTLYNINEPAKTVATVYLFADIEIEETIFRSPPLI